MAILCHMCGNENDVNSTLCKYCGIPVIIDEQVTCLPQKTVLDNRYEIIHLVKSGGMGAVYKAIDLRLDDVCAVKEMLSFYSSPARRHEAINRFNDEAKILTRLRHSNLPRIRDYFIEHDKYYLVMDFIDGTDLETIWYNSYGKKFDEKETVEWALQILNVLDYLHNQEPPVIYRDIKPSNIILRRDTGNVVLIDFGIARTISPEEARKTSSGTEGYSPPEQYRGIAVPQSDIYSLGATMHQLLSGEPPLTPFKFGSICDKNSTVSVEMERIIMKALEEKIEDRFLSAEHMLKAIVDLYRSSSDLHAATIAIKYQISSQNIIDIVSNESSIPVSRKTIAMDQIDGLILQLDNTNVELRKLAVESLGNYREERVVKALIKALEDKDTEVRMRAVVALGNTGNTDAIPYLMKILEKDTESLRACAATSMGKLMDYSALVPLIKALEDPAPSVRKQVAIALGLLGCSEAIKPLEDARNREGLLSIHMKDVMSEAIDRLTKGPTAGQYMEMADIFVKQGKFELAEECYKESLELKQNSYEIYVNLGNIYCSQRKYKEALEAYFSSLKLKPYNHEIYNAIGNIYSTLGDYQKAIEAYKQVIELEPDFATAYNNLGFAYYNQGEFYNAILEYRKSIALDERFPMAYNNLGNAYSALGNYELAIEEYRKALKLQPDMSLAHNNLGFAYAKMNKHDMAILSYMESIKLTPDFVMAYINLAFSYATQGKYEAAIKYYKKAIECAPNNYEAYMGLAQIYELCGHYDEAIEQYEEVLQTGKEDAKIYENIANIYLETGKFIYAIEEYRKALLVEPGRSDLYNKIAWIYKELKNYEQAIIEYQKAISLSPCDAKLYINLGYTYSSVKDYSSAIEKYREALKLESDNGNIYYNLGCVYMKMNDFNKAALEFNKVFHVTKDPELTEAAEKALVKIKNRLRRRKAL
ncbi:MAG: tetratricopeptide repeat protein [Candidatus Eremiobacterota bacterium]